MWTEVSRLNLIELAPALQAPVFFYLGPNDPESGWETSLVYIDALAAPSKELVWFEESGHEPFMDSRLGSTLRWRSWFGQHSPPARAAHHLGRAKGPPSCGPIFNRAERDPLRSHDVLIAVAHVDAQEGERSL